MNRQLMKELRFYYDALYENGVPRDKPIGIIENARTSQDGVSRLRSIFDIIFNSSKVSEDTKIYIANIKYSMRDVNEYLNNKIKESNEQFKTKNEEILYCTTSARVKADEAKILSIFGETLIRDCVYNRLINFKKIDECITQLYDKLVSNKKLRDNLLIRIRETRAVKKPTMQSEDFFAMLDSIGAYLVQRKDRIEQVINEDEEFVNMFNYLLSSESSGDTEAQKDKKKLIKFLNNEDYTEDSEE